MIGLQATLATTPTGDNPLALYSLVDGWLVEQRNDTSPGLRTLVEDARTLLGFPLEPELFSNMVFVAQLGDHEHSPIRRLARTLLRTFRDSDANGLYHFFTTLRFACDVDCTAIAAHARLRSGDLDLASLRGIRELRRLTQAILRSAAVDDLADGPLHRHVFKVYRDDHEVQGPELDRGLEHDPVVVANALFPVLFELSLGLRRPSDTIPLKEYRAHATDPRAGEATVADIVAANLRHLVQVLERDAWMPSSRRYPSPDVFLRVTSELVREFPELADPLGLGSGLREAIAARRASFLSDGPGDDDPFGPHRPLNVALRAIAAGNLELDASPERARIVSTQAQDGGWPGFDCFQVLATGVNDLTTYVGSPTLTATFCVRALADPLPSLRGRPFAGHRSWTLAVVEEILDRVHR